ncbi:MAG: ABC-F family ATP-binding cassette domain-containing protein [bacterium]|nr:ABC-F family ATP-binding cassette domain-containing protein [bacterium]
MSIIRLENVTKRFGGEPILDGVDFRVEDDDRIGLIGRNGTGKSTLFKLITGDLDSDGGVIERMRKARVACLAQLPDLNPDASVHDVVMGTFSDLRDQERALSDLEHRIADLGADGVHEGEAYDKLMADYGRLQDHFHVSGGYEFRIRAKRILGGLGFTEAEYEMPVHALSGGQRTRLLLALVLMEDADLLLLDEPENHLDIAAREWLESFLRDWPKAFVIISHDRYILDAAVRRVVEVERGGLSGFTGNYEAYRANRELTLEQQKDAYQRQQEFIEKEERWIERFRYKNTKASQVQSRIKRLEKLERVLAPPPEAHAPRFNLGDVVRSGQVVVDAADVSMAYDDLCLYRDLSFQVERGERVAIIGANGSGKTTLLRQLAGRLPDAGGAVSLGHKVTAGFYEQHHESLATDLDVFSEIQAARSDLLPEQIRTFMGRFLFSGDDVFKPVAALSGGELSRVAIAKLILSGANLLLLDEPTNHLDIASREALETALVGYPGTIVLVTHDRTLVDRLADRLIVIENGEATIHLGNYSDYRHKHEAAQAESTASLDDVMMIRKRAASKKRARNKEEQREQRKQRKRLEQIEDDIAAMEETITSVEAESATIDPNDYERARQLREQYEGMKGDLAEMYAEWERLAEEAGAT